MVAFQHAVFSCSVVCASDACQYWQGHAQRWSYPVEGLDNRLRMISHGEDAHLHVVCIIREDNRDAFKAVLKAIDLSDRTNLRTLWLY